MTKIYLIRHAEAEGNLYRRIHGWYDGAVTDMGYRQIEALKQRFADIKIDAVYSSDLKRARETAISDIYIPKKLPSGS
jgi:probable phosphoglycerate mutase